MLATLGRDVALARLSRAAAFAEANGGTDITHVFQVALAAERTWSHDDVQQALELLAGSEFRIDWEPGDEEWGCVFDSDRVRALVCARVPVGIALEGMVPARMNECLSWLTVSSMNDHVFSVDRSVLEQVFGRKLSANISYTRRSIDDCGVRLGRERLCPPPQRR